MGDFKIAAVVEAYHPPAAILQNIAALAPQVGHVMVVDNTPCPHSVDVLHELERLPGCSVLRNGKNLGIAAALNIGIRCAIAEGAHWVLTLDQDSEVSEGYVAAMLSAYAEVSRERRVGIMCPRYIDVGTKVEIPKLRNAHGEIAGCLTSGSMMEAGTFSSVGPLEEQFFMDYVDYEYCLRMRAQGFQLMECPDAVLFHSLGRTTLHRFLGRELTITNHSPSRRYYIHRNRLILIKRYFFKDREWALTEAKGLAMDSIAVLLMEEKKMAKAWYMIRALFDGVFNRMGQRVKL